jgi:hypothetical protein
MIGKIFITRSGYDPELGRHVKDPYLGANPSLGACRPDIRKQLRPGDHIFTISGKVREAPQFVMVGFEIASKISANDAYKSLPARRLHLLKDGQLDGNIIVDSRGRQHRLDDHQTFDRRTDNYILGTNEVVLATPEEIARGRRETLEALQEILKVKGSAPIDIVGRWGKKLVEDQVLQLRRWLLSIKRGGAA